MRTLSADYIFPVSSPPIKNGVVVIDDEGIILEVKSQKQVVNIAEPSEVKGQIECYNGIIVPGFVNTHCHLELSYLKGRISKDKGLTHFISELVSKRDKFPLEQIKSAIASAEEEMLRNGIVAIGDISNTDHSFEQKKKNRLAYHTFIEAFDLYADKAKSVLDAAVHLQSKISNLGHPLGQSSIVPHAPYTVSGKLMELIDNLKQPLLTIHNQETASENELFASGSGLLAEMMRRAGVDVDSKWKANRSILFVLGYLIESKKILFVHNTYSSREDMDLIMQYAQAAEIEAAFCLCPGANLYIENRLPDIPMFLEAGMKLCIGTDSYASNWSLSILDEMKTIAKHFPQIPFETLIGWATKNGAEFFGFEKELGTIEKGKKPGLNLIAGIDLGEMKFTDRAEVKRLV